jgi:hypothetical protein
MISRTKLSYSLIKAPFLHTRRMSVCDTSHNNPFVPFFLLNVESGRVCVYIYMPAWGFWERDYCPHLKVEKTFSLSLAFSRFFPNFYLLSKEEYAIFLSLSLSLFIQFPISTRHHRSCSLFSLGVLLPTHTLPSSMLFFFF